jgi:cell division protein FtsI/penicillin-binding protein 2
MASSYAEGDGPRVGRLFLYTIGALVVLFLVGTALSFAFGWIGGAAQIESFQNHKEQYTWAYQDMEALRAQAGNICDAKGATNIQPGAVLAYKQNYRRIEADYDRRMENAFEAKYVKPHDLPRRAPTLRDMLSSEC